ncbi:MAG: TIGR04283 family arsenosugar biosynthesis glycosyltransferase [Saprospiraceae bacterium]|nr:TIGR04283 family arsenosugar biosynthesis glycosyltransferase [Saprospiraceae bacterium]
MTPLISIIIPTFNEEKYIPQLIIYLKSLEQIELAEIIVTDGGSQDKTLTLIQNDSIVLLSSRQKGRAAQMNFAAEKARGKFLYFLHADTRPPQNIIQLILDNAPKKALSCLRYHFESDKFLLKINGYFTRFNGVWAGGGDQSLIIATDLFNLLGGFSNTKIIMEDFDLVQRASHVGYPLIILPHYMLVSARKYEHNTWLKVQLMNFITVLAWKMGASQDFLFAFYHKKLNP